MLKKLLWLIPTFIFGIVIGMFIFSVVDGALMNNYDLYNCIYNNADANGFNQNPVMIKKIQDECICFRENNYTNLLEVNCSK